MYLKEFFFVTECTTLFYLLPYFSAPKTTVRVTNHTVISSSEVLLQWMVDDLDAVNGDITHYQILYFEKVDNRTAVMKTVNASNLVNSLSGCR